MGSLGPSTSLLSELATFATFVFFLGSYAALMGGIGAVLWTQLLLDDLAHLGFGAVAASATHRWALVFLLAALAGLPPFFFFFCKINLLVVLLNSGALGAFIFLLVTILLSWYAYYVGLAKLLLMRRALQPAPELDATVRVTMSLFLVSIGLAALCLVLFLEDIVLLVFWMSRK